MIYIRTCELCGRKVITRKSPCQSPIFRHAACQRIENRIAAAQAAATEFARVGEKSIGERLDSMQALLPLEAPCPSA